MDTRQPQPGWRALDAVRKSPQFIALARADAEGKQRFARWRPGVERDVEPLPKATGNIVIDVEQFAAEAQGPARYARYTPGAPHRTVAQLQVNVAELLAEPASVEADTVQPVAEVIEHPSWIKRTWQRLKGVFRKAA